MIMKPQQMPVHHQAWLYVVTDSQIYMYSGLVWACAGFHQGLHTFGLLPFQSLFNSEELNLHTQLAVSDVIWEISESAFAA